MIYRIIKVIGAGVLGSVIGASMGIAAFGDAISGMYVLGPLFAIVACYMTRSIKVRLVITLGVNDLQRAMRFYRDGLGLKTNGVVGGQLEFGAVAFFDLHKGVKLAAWPYASMAHDTGLSQDGHAPTGVTIGYNQISAWAVDRLMKKAARAGATILKPAQKTFWGGYSGYFHDPDGHLWEIVWNPAM